MLSGIKFTRSYIATLLLIGISCFFFMHEAVNAQRLSNQFGNLVSSAPLIKQINENPQSTFKAQMYPQFDSTSKLIMFARNLNNKKAKLSTVKAVTGEQFLIPKGLPVPPQYDLRQIWGECVGGIQDEGQCGSVWAMVPSATVSDRMCIQSNGKFQERLSTEYVLECDNRDFGCNGGYLNTEFEFELKKGIPTEKCVPYSAGNGTTGACPTRCVNGQPLVLYKTKAVQNITGEADMQQAILQGGSIMSEIDMYQDFLMYTKGVYQHSPSLRQPIGQYVLRIVGWGILNGVKYWIAPNIFGKNWGMDGYIYIRRGINESNIEKDVFAFQVY